VVVQLSSVYSGKSRWHGPKLEGAGEEGVLPLALDGLEIVLAQAQQGEVALQDVANGDARAAPDRLGPRGL
jgi:hypothetical protein